MFCSERWEKNVCACEYKERDRQAERTRDRDRKGKKKLRESVGKILPENASGTLVSQRAGSSLSIPDFLRFDLMEFLCFQSR